MPEPTADCFEEIEATLKRSVAALDGARVPFLLGGSLAVWAHGGPESCNDLDLMVRPSDAEAALEALEEAGMRPERPAEDWLLKAWDGEVLVDLIFGPQGLPLDDEVFARAAPVGAFGLDLKAMSLEDIFTTKLLSLDEHYLDLEQPLQMARAVREQVEWDDVKRRTQPSPYARAFFTLIEGLGVCETGTRAPGRSDRPHVRLAE